MVQYLHYVMRRVIVLLVVIIVLAIGIKLWWDNGVSAPTPSDTSSKIFIIQKGKTIREIASDLQHQGLLKDSIIFFLYVKLYGKDKDIQAGDYRLSASMNIEKLVNTLTHGTLDKWVVFPEGLRAEEYSEILKKSLKTYKPSWNEALVENNGYLFPDTYLFPQDADIETIVTKLKDTFTEKTSTITKNTTYSLSEIVVVASLIEREANKDEEKPLIASVIYNRLAQGMPLQIDATVQYALGYQENERRWWKKELSYDDLRVVSVYNTYTNIGLPPRPISNPGIVSLTAAASPATSDYLFYLHDKKGEVHFAKTSKEHADNVKKYL